jgi:hypothetical protein
MIQLEARIKSHSQTVLQFASKQSARSLALLPPSEMKVVSHSAALMLPLHRQILRLSTAVPHAPVHALTSAPHLLAMQPTHASESKLHAPLPAAPVSPAAEDEVPAVAEPPLPAVLDPPEDVPPALVPPALVPPEPATPSSSLAVLLQAPIAAMPKPKTTVKQADKARILFGPPSNTSSRR